MPETDDNRKILQMRPLDDTPNAFKIERVITRPAKIEDIPQLVSLEKRSFRTFYRKHQFTAATFDYYLKNPRAIVHLAIIDMKIVGYVLGIVQTGRLRHIARLNSLAVAIPVRNKGIGSCLLEEFIEWARNRKTTVVILEVAAVNSIGSHLFVNHGFIKVRRLTNHYDHKIDGIRMKREL